MTMAKLIPKPPDESDKAVHYKINTPEPNKNEKKKHKLKGEGGDTDEDDEEHSTDPRHSGIQSEYLIMPAAEDAD